MFYYYYCFLLLSFHLPIISYPLSCIRLQPVQRCPRVDLQGALGCFLSDIRERLQSVCGFPARLTSKPSYCSVNLTTAASLQVRRFILLSEPLQTQNIYLILHWFVYFCLFRLYILFLWIFFSKATNRLMLKS